MSDKTYNVESLKGTITIPTSDSVTTGTAVLGETNGLTKTIFFTTPDMEGSDSTNFQIVNSSGYAFMTSGTKAESTTTILGTSVAIIPGDKIVVTAEGTQSADVAIVYDIRMMR